MVLLAMPISSTLERLIPEAARGGVTGEETVALHLDRYRFAAKHTLPGRFLDLACGAGYGTRLVSNDGPTGIVGIGVDVSPEAISYANATYAHERIRFEVGDAMLYGDPGSFDTIITLETIEHLPKPRRFVERLRALLRPGGVLITSAPVTPSTDANPHHMTDFTARSFRALFTGLDLREIGHLVQIQQYSPLGVVTRSEERLQEVRRGLFRYYVHHPGSLLRRVVATARYGFSNRYLTLAWKDIRYSL